jgi:hypothetical protein
MEQGAAPAGRARNPALGRSRGSAWRPLRAARQELADQDGANATWKARPGNRKEPRWSAERRAGWRYQPVISGEPEIGPTARRATGCGASAPSACRRSAPLVAGGKEDNGVPDAANNTGRAALASRVTGQQSVGGKGAASRHAHVVPTVWDGKPWARFALLHPTDSADSKGLTRLRSGWSARSSPATTTDEAASPKAGIKAQEEEILSRGRAHAKSFIEAAPGGESNPQ